MKKQLLKLLLIVAMCVPWVTHAQTLTVCDGSATEEHFPIYGLYMDEAQKTQMIYPASLLEDMLGKNVTRMTFYSNDPSVSWSGSVNVSMAVTSASSVPSDFLSEAMTTVYSGTLSVSNSQMVIDFTTPFFYPETGGNLLLEFEEPVAGNWSGCTFLGVNNEGASRYRYGSYNNSASTFLPKVTFRLANPTLTVCDGNLTTSYVPVYGTWMDAPQKTQSIYSDDMLTQMRGKDITKLTYYTSTASVNWTSTVTVSLAVTDATSVSSGFINASTTPVYTGRLSVANSRMVVEFDEPFSYPAEGGNLLVQFQQTSGGDYASCYFYGVSGTSRYQYNSTGGTTSVVPKVTFDYSVHSACAAPSDLTASDVTSNSASFSWASFGGNTDWDLVVSNVALDDPSLSATIYHPTTTSYTASGLNPSTDYYAYVRSNCGSEGVSRWINATFHTSSLLASLPIEMDFDDDSAAPYWDMIGAGQTNHWTIADGTLHVTNGTGNNYTNNSISNSYAVMTVNIPTAGSYICSFDWKCTGESTWDFGRAFLAPATANVVAGAAPGGYSSANQLGLNIPAGWLALDGANTSSAARLNLHSSMQSQYLEFPVTTPGLYKVILYWGNDGSSGSNPAITIDNFVFMENRCGLPANLAISDVNAHEAVASWDAFGNEMEWNVELIDANGTVVSTVVNNNTINFSDLLSGSYYQVRVQANCGTDGSSQWATTSFVTSSHVTDLAISNVAAHTASLSWNAEGDETSWDVLVISANGDTISANVTNNEYVCPSLLSGVYYTAKVRANCAVDGSSQWTSAGFTTLRHLTNLTTDLVSAGAAQLSWNTNGVDPYNGVTFEYRNVDSIDWVMAGTVMDSSYLVYALEQGTEYVVRVTPICSLGDANEAEFTSFVTDTLKCIGAEDYVFSTGSTTQKQRVPVDVYYNYSFSEMMVGSNEIDTGSINAIEFRYAGTDNPANRAVTIYVGTTSNTNLTTSNYIPVSQLTPVFDGNLSFSNGWNRINFNQGAFHYNGEGNLVIAVDNHTGSYVGSTSSTFYYHSAPYNTVYYNQDGAPFSGSFSGTMSGGRPDMILHVGECIRRAQCAAPMAQVTDYGCHTVDVEWIPGGAETQWNIYYKEASADDYTFVETVTAMNYQFTNLEGNTQYKFRVESTCGDEAHAIDLTATTLPSCIDPMGLTVSAIGNNRATFTWTPGSRSVDYLNNNEQSYIVRYGVLGGTTATTRTLGDTTLTVTNCAPATTYYVTVQSNCGDIDGMGGKDSVVFTTDPVAVTLPYECNFDGNVVNYKNNWVFLQNGQTNHWMMGNDAHAGSNGNALYITNDDAANAYSNNSTSYAYAYIQFTLADTGEYEYSFDWHGYGEGGYDYMRVALMPATMTLTNGTNNGFSTTTHPAGAIALDGGSKLNLASDWNNRYGTLNIGAGQTGVYRMVFYWYNDASMGTNPPAAVDNLTLRRLTCHKPQSLVAALQGNDTAVLSWVSNEPAGVNQWQIEYGVTGFAHGEGTMVLADTMPYTIVGFQPNLTYDFYVRNVCGSTPEEDDNSAWSNPAHVTTTCGVITELPYTFTFENDVNNQYANCWYGINIPATNDTTGLASYAGVVSTSQHYAGAKALVIKQHANVTNDQYAITPMIDLPMGGNQVTFYGRNTNYATPVTVGVMTDTADAATFTAIETVTVGTAFAPYNVMLDGYNGNGRYLAFRVPASENTNSVVFDNITVDYMPSCPVTTNLTAENTADGIRMNWNGHKNAVSQWQIAYTALNIDSAAQYTVYDTLVVNASERQADGTYVMVNPELVTNYTFKVRNICDAENGEFGPWSNTVNLTTDICANMFIDTIGALDSNALSSNFLPVVTNYKYSYTQQIVLADEIDVKAAISAIRFKFDYSDNFRVKNNVSIYLGLTSKTAFSSNTDFEPLSNLTQVYSGALRCDADDWTQLIFDTPFSYDGSSNLIVAVVDNSNANASLSNKFAVAAAGANRAIYARSDSPINTNGTVTGTRMSSRNVMQFVSCVNCSAPADLATIAGFTTATASWTDNAPALGHEVVITRADANADWDTLAAASSNYTFSNLDSATTYIWYVRNNCAANINSAWTSHFVSTNNYVEESICDNQTSAYDFVGTTAGMYSGDVATTYGDMMHTVVNLDVRATTAHTISPVACDSYTWADNGRTYTNSVSGETATVVNAAGCDSVITMNLTVNYSTTSTDVQTACDTYTWMDDVTYTESTTGVATFTTTNAVACDSVITLDLTINHSNGSTYDQSACDTYTWPLNGVTYTANENEANVVLANQYGCDSTVTLNLTVNYSKVATDTVIACDTYTWIDGVTYTSSINTPTATTTTVAGCDSVVTLHLTVNYSTQGTDVITACDSYTWIDGVTYTASNNTAEYHIANRVGCDSLVHLNLTINYSSNVTDTQVACDSYTWPLNGATYTASTNVPAVVYNNAVGCDSVITLHLTVNNSTNGVDVQNACDTYTWIDGVVYTASNNEATFTLAGANTVGCDSTVTLNLNMGYSNSAIDPQVACVTYTWPANGETYTASTDAPVAVLTNAMGCDSTVTLNLTINPKYTITYVANMAGVTGTMPTPSICAGESYTLDRNRYSILGYRLDGWALTADATEPDFATDAVVVMNNNMVLYGVWVEGCPEAIKTLNFETCSEYTWRGNTYTQTGIYMDTVRGAFYGICDSVYQLNLVINMPTASTYVAEACDTYTWPLNGRTYRGVPSEPATVRYTNAAGCDSVVTLALNLKQSTTRQDVVTVCDTYTWPVNNATYTNSTTAQFTTTNEAGCDSIVSLALTVNYSNTAVQTVTACENYTWHGATYAASTNMPTYATTNVAGCDSVVTLHLTINHASTGVLNVAACESYTWNGTTYTASTNAPTRVLGIANAAGCDSIQNLHLTINHGTTAIVNVDACDNYTWNGTTYYASTNTPSRAIASGNMYGCDSIEVLHLAIHQSVATTDNVTACDTYTWDNNTYGMNGQYLRHLSTVYGCDSAVTLNLTILRSAASNVVAQACGSYSWHGTTYTNSGRYNYNTVAANGCDSVVTLVLTIGNTTYGNTYVTACDSYTWGGTTYTANTNNATATLQGANALGCDSVVTLHLTINHSTASTEVVSACNSYTWKNGVVYTASTNEPTFVTLNAAGCDSVITLNLTINHGNTIIEEVEACDTYTWARNHKTYRASTNNPTVTVPSQEGCDDIINLHLTVNYSVEQFIEATAASSYTWNGTTYDESGDYKWIGATTAGCDSIVNLHLVITGVGIDAADALEALTLYPNPTAGKVTFSATEVMKVEVMDLYGRKVAVFDNTNVIDLTNLPTGTYTLRVTLPEGTAVRKVVKR